MDRFLLGIILLGLTLFVAWSEVSRQHAQEEAAQRDEVMAAEIEAVRNEARAAFTSLIPQSVVAQTNQSVYAIVAKNRLYGTAFVIDRENGLLGTAAHVGEALPFDEEGAQIVVLNRFNGAPLPALSIRNHAGYGTFRTLIEAYQPIRPQTPILNPQVLPLRDLAFDAAVLKVDPVDPVTGENRLGPDLPIADEEALLSLAAGAPIGVIGFPYDTLDDTFRADSATSRVDRGVISAMIAPLDNASARGDPEVANLIIHRLSTAGGNSGSPIIDASGAVIGIHTHGVESLSGNADGAAQRADVLRDLMEEGRDAQRLEDVFIPAWRRLLGFWAPADVVLPWSFYLERTDKDGAEDLLVADFADPSDKPFALSQLDLSFGPTQKQFTAEADDLSAPDGERVIFEINEEGEFSRTTIEVDRSQNNVVYAFDYSLRRQLGFCRLAAYWRRGGETELTSMRPRPSVEIFLPALDGGPVETVDIIFRRRAECDPPSNAFKASVISWEGPAPNPPTNILAAFFQRSDPESLIASRRSGGQGFSKIMNLGRGSCGPDSPDGVECGDADAIPAERAK